jgi:hypothetical protein
MLGHFTAGIHVSVRVHARVRIRVRIPANIPAPARVVRLANVRIYCVGFCGLPGNIVPEGSRIAGLLLGFLLQPRCVNLGLLRVSTGTARPRLLLTRIKLHRFRLPAHFGGLFPIRLIPLLLHCPAPTARHQEHDEKDHHNNANNNPNPGCNVQATHLFPFASTGPALPEWPAPRTR